MKLLHCKVYKYGIRE